MGRPIRVTFSGERRTLSEPNVAWGSVRQNTRDRPWQTGVISLRQHRIASTRRADEPQFNTGPTRVSDIDAGDVSLTDRNLLRYNPLRDWSRGDSNPRPLACHASVLPTELRPRRVSAVLPQSKCAILPDQRTGDSTKDAGDSQRRRRTNVGNLRFFRADAPVGSVLRCATWDRDRAT